MMCVCGKIDWYLLRQQKAALLAVMLDRRGPSAPEMELLDGLLNMLDSMQDQAAKVLGDKQIFGEL